VGDPWRIEHRVGNAVVHEAYSPDGRFSVFFEDDGESGYLYGLDLTDAAPEDMPIVDALFIYDVAAVADRHATYPVEIRWADDGHRAGLFVEGRCHAVFDFDQRRASCRTGFPPASGEFTASHEWDESLTAGL
jgi:hypothetical protein